MINDIMSENQEDIPPTNSDDLQLTLLDMRFNALVKRVDLIEMRLTCLNSQLESIESRIASLSVD